MNTKGTNKKHNEKQTKQTKVIRKTDRTNGRIRIRKEFKKWRK